MQTIPLEMRKRILMRHDTGKHTRQEVADAFGVSLGLVKKLLSQRKQLGHFAPLYDRVGRKPAIREKDHAAIRAYLAVKPGATLVMIRQATGIAATTQALHVVLGKLGITLKKSHSARGSRTARTSAPPAKPGKPACRRWTPGGLCSSTNPPRKRT
jgi:transposase